MTNVAMKIVGTFEIAKLRLAPGDVLVVKTDRIISSDTADRIRKHLAPRLPEGVKSLIINPDIELSVLTRTEIDAKAA